MTDDLNLRRLACVAQGGHIFPSRRHDYPCKGCELTLHDLWSTNLTPNDLNRYEAPCYRCEPYEYADCGTKFGRRP